MNFWNTVYTDVTWIQLWIGFIGMIIFMALAAWGWLYAIDQKNRADIWEACENVIRIRLNDRIDNEIEKKSILIDKVRSLEAEIARITVRPRDKMGRFLKSKGK